MTADSGTLEPQLSPTTTTALAKAPIGSPCSPRKMRALPIWVRWSTAGDTLRTCPNISPPPRYFVLQPHPPPPDHPKQGLATPRRGHMNRGGAIADAARGGGLDGGS